MELRKLRCSNCNGSLTQHEDGKYYCDSCGTSYMLDMDPEDVAYEQMRTITSAVASVSGEAKKVSRLFAVVQIVICIIIIIAAIAITGLIIHSFKADSKRQNEYRESVSREIEQRESEFYEDYDRVSQHVGG